MSSVKVGSVVYLKSGSPAMTVKACLSQEMCVCHWFIGDTIQEFTFHEYELTDIRYSKDIPGAMSAPGGIPRDGSSYNSMATFPQQETDTDISDSVVDEARKISET